MNPLRAATRILFVLSLLISDLHADPRPERTIPDGSDTRDRFLKLIARPQVPLAPNERTPSSSDGLTEIGFDFVAEANQRVPGLMIKPSSSPESVKRPVVIVLHGTGSDKLAMKPWLKKIAAEGLNAVAFDARHSGERATFGKGSDAYRAALLETWKSGRDFPFLYDTVWDLMRLIDYLQTRPDVDPERIAAIGFSKGGTELYLAAAADPRLVASVSCIGVQSFEWALENQAWHSRIATIQSAVEGAATDAGLSSVDTAFVRRFYRRVAPGLDHEFDGPRMLPLIAPRPLLVINGDRDDRTPRAGVELCISAAKVAYRQQQAEDQFQFLVQENVGHAVTPQSEKYALEWLKKQLKSPQAHKR